MRTWSRGDGCDRCGKPVDVDELTHCAECRAMYLAEYGEFQSSLSALCAQVGIPHHVPDLKRQPYGREA